MLAPPKKCPRNAYDLSLWCLPDAVAAREGGGGGTTPRTALTPSGRGFYDFLSLLARHGTNNFNSLLLGFFSCEVLLYLSSWSM